MQEYAAALEAQRRAEREMDLFANADERRHMEDRAGAEFGKVYNHVGQVYEQTAQVYDVLGQANDQVHERISQEIDGVHRRLEDESEYAQQETMYLHDRISNEVGQVHQRIDMEVNQAGMAIGDQEVRIGNLEAESNARRLAEIEAEAREAEEAALRAEAELAQQQGDGGPNEDDDPCAGPCRNGECYETCESKCSGGNLTSRECTECVLASDCGACQQCHEDHNEGGMSRKDRVQIEDGFGRVESRIDSVTTELHDRMDAEAAARLEALEEFHPTTNRRVRQSVQVNVQVGDLELTVGSFVKAA